MAASLANRLGSVLIVGGGHMGQAILAGLLRGSDVPASSIVVANPGLPKREHIQATYGVECIASATDCKHADTCILAVRPQIIEEVMSAIAQSGLSPQRIISVAAGTKTSSIAAHFPHSGIVRTMPNIPLVHGCAVTGISGGENTSEDDVLLAKDMFSCMGKAEIVPEDLQDAVVAVSGSGTAYFAFFTEAVARAGEELGLSHEMAQEMALYTMLGAGTLMQAESKSPSDVIAEACSVGGTTEAAIHAMRANNVADGIFQGVQAAFKRSKELA